MEANDKKEKMVIISKDNENEIRQIIQRKIQSKFNEVVELFDYLGPLRFDKIVFEYFNVDAKFPNKYYPNVYKSSSRHALIDWLSHLYYVISSIGPEEFKLIINEYFMIDGYPFDPFSDTEYQDDDDDLSLLFRIESCPTHRSEMENQLKDSLTVVRYLLSYMAELEHVSFETAVDNLIEINPQFKPIIRLIAKEIKKTNRRQLNDYISVIFTNISTLCDKIKDKSFAVINLVFNKKNKSKFAKDFIMFVKQMNYIEVSYNCFPRSYHLEAVILPKGVKLKSLTHKILEDMKYLITAFNRFRKLEKSDQEKYLHMWKGKDWNDEIIKRFDKKKYQSVNENESLDERYFTPSSIAAFIISKKYKKSDKEKEIGIDYILDIKQKKIVEIKEKIFIIDNLKMQLPDDPKTDKLVKKLRRKFVV